MSRSQWREMVHIPQKILNTEAEVYRYFSEIEGGKRRRILSEQQQREFLHKDFVTFEYNNLSPEQEEDLFARVQMGVQLNLAEKMRASTGPWQELARLFVDDFPTVFELIKDRARSKDFQLALSCFSQIVECMHPTAANGVPILKTNHTHLPKLLSNKGAVDDALKSHLASVWNTFQDLIDADPDTFTNANKYLRGVQTFAPVEMVAVAVLISMHSETRNNRLLLGDIQAMRTAVRESFVDLRMNATVWKWYWDYIENLEAIRGAIDGSTVNRRTKQRTEKKDAVPAGSATASSTVAAINAAAAAPKKGRVTARTKRPTEASVVEAPEETPFAVKSEPDVVPMPASPPPKRRRTEDTLPTGFLEDEDAIRGSRYPRTAQSVGTPQVRTNTTLSLQPQPTHAPSQSPIPTTRKPRQRAEPALSALPRKAPVPQRASGPTDQARSQVSTPAPTELRRQQVQQPDNYVPAPRSLSALPSVLPEYSPQQSAEPPQAPVAPMLAGAGVFSSNHSTWQDRRTRQSERPLIGAWSGVPLPGSSQNASTSMPHWPQGQHDEPIDLTSDTEQERASLLSAFKTRPVSAGATKDTSKLAPQPASQNRKPNAKEPKTSSQELPTRENNPYTRYKRP
jgi:hypothetical protein